MDHIPSIRDLLALRQHSILESENSLSIESLTQLVFIVENMPPQTIDDALIPLFSGLREFIEAHP
jgi:hypothetical protein